MLSRNCEKYISRCISVQEKKQFLTNKKGWFIELRFDWSYNVCFIKIQTKHSSNTLLSLVRIFMKLTLFENGQIFLKREQLNSRLIWWPIRIKSKVHEILKLKSKKLNRQSICKDVSVSCATHPSKVHIHTYII